MMIGRRVGMRTRRATTKTSRARTKRSWWSCACGCGRERERRRRVFGCRPTAPHGAHLWRSRRSCGRARGACGRSRCCESAACGARGAHGPAEAGSVLLLRAGGAACGAQGAHGPAEALLGCSGLTALPAELGALTRLQTLDATGAVNMRVEYSMPHLRPRQPK
jgi:hypothetical protein